jgi:alpha-ketoglutarate-dependent taurine dioxygenase
VVVGTDVANRNRLETEHLIGFFINQLVLRTDLSANPTFKELLGRVREAALSAYQYQDLPFDKLVEELEPFRRLSHTPIFQVLFVLENMPLQSVELPGLTFEPFPLDISAAKYDLGMLIHEQKDGIKGTCLYRTELFDASTIKRICLRFQRLLENIVVSPDARLRELEVMADAPEKKGEPGRRARFLQSVKLRTVNLASGRLVNTGYLSSGQGLPLVMTPAVDDFDPVEWAGIEREFIEKNLLKHGAILFRGFKLREPSEFERFASSMCPELFSDYGDLPREAVSGRVYGSTPYPNDQAILFHNESSHMHSWPLKIWFYCLTAPQQGGETPLVDCRELYREIDPRLIQKFSDKRLMYVRNFNNGLDVSWQNFFKSADPAAVEEFCRQAGIVCEWMEGNTLRTKKVCQAVATHPKTGELVFFNQLQAHHVSCLNPTAREALLNLFGEEGLPRNVYYGDGEPIPDSVVNELQDLYEKRARSFRWQQGDILMVDNMLAAHGRRPFVGPRKIVVAMGEMISATL